jgi:LPS sulfotransferase NodH
LSSTGVLGHPESYFREPDEAMWAEQFGLPIHDGRVLDYRAFAAGARAAGLDPEQTVRGSVHVGVPDHLLLRLDRASDASDLSVIEKAFGTLAFVHLRREGLLEQAVSWCRAEQTGYWQHGDIATSFHHLDLDRLKEILNSIQAHNAAWHSWFQAEDIEPLVVTYEELVSDPRAVVTGIAEHVSVELPAVWRPQSTHRKQADELNGAHHFHRRGTGPAGRNFVLVLLSRLE